MEKSHATRNEKKITHVTSSPLIMNYNQRHTNLHGPRWHPRDGQGWGYGRGSGASEITEAGQGHWWGLAPARAVIGRERWRGSQ